MQAWEWHRALVPFPLATAQMQQLISRVLRCDFPSMYLFLGIHELQLLEDHFKSLREEDGVVLDEDGEEDWGDWEVESDSGSESESEGWIDVSDDDKDLDISDSDDDEEKTKGKKAEEIKEVQQDEETRISTLATTKVCY